MNNENIKQAEELHRIALKVSMNINFKINDLMRSTLNMSLTDIFRYKSDKYFNARTYVIEKIRDDNRRNL